MLFKMNSAGYIDYDGVQVHPISSNFDSPIVPSRGDVGTCWVIKKGLFKYVLIETYVQYIFYSNTWGWKVDRIGFVFDKDLGRIIFPYNEKDAAIKKCSEMNKGRKVKIKYMR